jgi:GrpB-like predicted nucleotidyltransferase (UPF0157 family)
MLGLPPRVVWLVPHAPEWSARYAEEAALIQAAIGAYLVDLQHYGSTAVPGLAAKPILDILGGLRRFEDATACITPLVALGYDDAGTTVIPGQHLFGKGYARTVLLHLVEYNSPHWIDNLRFRDALRNDPALAQAYESLKFDLSRRYADDRGAYTAAKTEFIRRVLDGGAV